MTANNEIGTIQPAAALGELSHGAKEQKHRILFFIQMLVGSRRTGTRR
jgi:cysteine sulfinate desulfinase/cysteine desulfurase-like protein